MKTNPEQEKQKIVGFLKNIFREQGMSKAVIGLSGGIDSTTSLFLLKKKSLILLTSLSLICFTKRRFLPDVAEALEKFKLPKEKIISFQSKNRLTLWPIFCSLKAILTKKSAVATSPRVCG